MDRLPMANRREAIGIASLAVAVFASGASAETKTSKPDGKKPSKEALDRALRLYGGEFGGGVR